MSALFALLLAASSPATEAAQEAIAAERDFAAMAQAEGQWTAFRAYAAQDGVMFAPQPINAQQALAGAEDPPNTVASQPARSFVSCDGTLVVNTGPWQRPWVERTGYFTTVWQRQPDGEWRWLLDHGDRLETPITAPEEPEVTEAGCPDGPIEPFDPPAAPEASEQGGGHSLDNSLHWTWRVAGDGSRTVSVYLYDAHSGEHRAVLTDRVGDYTP